MYSVAEHIPPIFIVMLPRQWAVCHGSDNLIAASLMCSFDWRDIDVLGKEQLRRSDAVFVVSLRAY